MNNETKQQAFDLRFRQIATSKVNPREKMMMFEKLFSDIGNPSNLTFEDYMREKADRELRKNLSAELYDMYKNF